MQNERTGDDCQGPNVTVKLLHMKVGNKMEGRSVELQERRRADCEEYVDSWQKEY